MQNTQANDIIQNVIFNSAKTFFSPRERMTVSEAAEKYRIMSTVSARAGRWQTLSFQKDLLDAFNDPKIERIYIESGTQLGKTETILNVILWIVLFDPSPILVVTPRDADAKKFSQRVRDMVENSPALKERFTKTTSADVQNVYTQTFRGGFVTFAHAGSSASLAMTPVKYLFCDEIDKEEYYKNLNNEGTALKLAEARTDNFELTGRKIIYTCSPTTETGNIHTHFLKGDQRYFHIPCKACGEYFKIKFNEHVIWQTEETEKPHKHFTDTARIKCPNCGYESGEKERLWSIERGKYVATQQTKNIASFNIASVYSPLRRLSTLVAEFVDCKESQSNLKTFINTKLAETYVEKGESYDPMDLYNRREKYVAQVPKDCVILLLLCDVQVDRIEAGCWGFGRNDEIWLIDYNIIPGDPHRPEVWQGLDKIRSITYQHETGSNIHISLTGIDAGFAQDEVLKYVQRNSHNCYAVRGNNKPQLQLCQRSKDAQYPVYWMATDIIKDIIYSRFKNKTPGERYIHIPDWVTHDICIQLTSNERKEVKRQGLTTTRWMKRTSSIRDEALDTLVYAIGLFDISAYSKNIEHYYKDISTTNIKINKADTPSQPQQPKRNGHGIMVKGGMPW